MFCEAVQVSAFMERERERDRGKLEGKKTPVVVVCVCVIAKWTKSSSPQFSRI